MVNFEHIERLYQFLDLTSETLAKQTNQSYLEGICEAVNLLMSQSVDLDLMDEPKRNIEESLSKINEIEFQKEEVRKALQLCILKGFKNDQRNVVDITPDTIGIFIAFLVEKLYPNYNKLTLFDPLMGTGNLILSVANILKIKTDVIGIENDITRYHLAQAMVDAMGYDDQLFFQDTLLCYNIKADVIITDFPYSQLDNQHYFPYDCITHHHQNLTPGGYIIGIIPNDFFEIEGADLFKDVIKDLWQVIGLIKLPDMLFKKMGKSIFIMQKLDESVTKVPSVLLADITTFEDEELFSQQLAKINDWFKTRRE